MKRILLLFLAFPIFGQAQETTGRDYCSEIVIEKDKFDGKTTKYSPAGESVGFMKAGTTIYLSLRVEGHTLSIGEKGVTILLENNQKISKPLEKIDIDTGSNGRYEYTAFITLTPKDIEKLTKFSITDFRLYIYEASVGDGEKFKEYLKCLTKK